MSIAAPLETSSDEPAEVPFPGLPARELPIWMDKVSKWYGPVIGVNELSLRVNGGIAALLGPNGAGKSTLIKLLTGQLRPSLGRIRVYGRSVRSPAARRKLGYCPDADAFYEEMSGRDFVHALVRMAGYPAAEARERTERALEIVGMADTASRQQASKRLRGCSKGMRQRIKLAQALAHDPELLILDEPMSGLDPVGRRDFQRLFRKLADQGKTLLISSHLLAEIEELADSVVLIAQGRILTQGTWEEVAGYLEHLPQPLHLCSDRIRELAARLAVWPGVADLHFKSDEECIVTTTDPVGLCEQISRLVCEEKFHVTRLQSHEQWAGTLFELASNG
jgi:ABC-2 type transport system ATP-binding protein